MRHLAVHRVPPPDIPYKEREEYAQCGLCKWNSGVIFDASLDKCHHPMNGPGGYWCSSKNETGLCKEFHPSKLTRLLRRVGLRMPVWRPNEQDIEGN